MGVRVILQTGTSGRLGIIFDDDGVRGISEHDIDNYATDGKPCCLLVNADGPVTTPLRDFGFSTTTIVVTSPELPSKPSLDYWERRYEADQFVAPTPLCLEVVYLLYVEFFK